MKTRQEVKNFLNDLQWRRFNKAELEKHLSKFFGKEMTLEEYELEDDDITTDYSFVTTTGDFLSTSSYVDIEIYYAKPRRKGFIIVTETEILDYQP